MRKTNPFFNKDIEPGSDDQQQLITMLDMSQAMTRLGSWHFDTCSNKLHWSKELYLLLGLEPDDSPVDFNQLFLFIHPDDRERVEQVYQQSLARGNSHDIEYRIVGEYDTIRYFHDRCRLIMTEGNSSCFAGCLQDITELKQARQAVKTAREELDSFASIVSHDLQESVRAVVGFLQFLHNKNMHQLDDNGRHLVDRSVKAGKRMQGQMNALLEFARISSRGGKFIETDLTALAAEAVSRLEPYIQKRAARIRYSQLPAIRVDAEQIATLFYNLLHNGLLYNENDTPSVEINVTGRQHYFQFSCTDNGIGIATQFHERIFKIFQRLHSQQDYPGIGMGLPICRKIIERHGGSIWITSSENKGITICFTLPRDLER